jgi:hypothetical protein
MNMDINQIFFALFVAEQLVMVQFGSYPYHWGIIFDRRSIPSDVKLEDVGGFFGRLKIKTHSNGDIYLRYKHLPLTWGPYVLVGKICKEAPNELIIRLGPLTCVFFVVFIVQGTINGLASTITSLVTVSFFIWYFFLSFLRGYEKSIEQAKSKI